MPPCNYSRPPVFGPLDDLERSHNGPIPSALRENAADPGREARRRGSRIALMDRLAREQVFEVARLRARLGADSCLSDRILQRRAGDLAFYRHQGAKQIGLCRKD